MRRRCPRRCRPHEAPEDRPPSLGTILAPCSQPPVSKGEKSIADFIAKGRSEFLSVACLLASPWPSTSCKTSWWDTLPFTLQFTSSMSAIYFSLSPSIISEASKSRTLKVSACPKSSPNVALRALLLCARSRLFATDDELTQPLHELT